MIERLIILVMVVAAMLAGWWMLRLWRAHRLAQLAGQSPFAGIIPAGRPAVVAFSTPGCNECRTQQAPALARLRAQFGETISIHTLSAPEHPALVDQLGLLTVPATVVLDQHGTVRNLNLGYANEQRLAEQVRGV